MNFEHKDYPSFYKNTDRYSLEGQQTYLKWIRVELFVLIVAAGISLFPLSNDNYGQIFAILTVIAFTIGIAVTFYIKNAKFEDKWYIGRALAESVKSLTWKYMTNGEPFIADLTMEIADNRFIETLKNILEENRNFLSVTYEEDDGVNITEKMRTIRQSTFQERKDVYINSRIKDQQSWYKRKAEYNKRQSSNLFWAMIIFQFIALIYSLYLIIDPQFFNAVPIVATIAAAILSWLQIKQHQELSQSYAVAANDINLILSQEPYIDTEEKLAIFIADSETAFSREHTLWAARRDVFSYSKK